LYAEGVRDVWLEGGPTLAGAFLEAGAVDEVIAYVAPMLLGSGLSALQSPAVSTIADAWRLDPVDVTAVGADVRITARPRRDDAAGEAGGCSPESWRSSVPARGSPLKATRFDSPYEDRSSPATSATATRSR